MNKAPFVVLPRVSVRPDSLVFYNEFHRSSKLHSIPNPRLPEKPKADKPKTDNPVLRLPAANQHNFELSHKAAKRIRQKVTWLYNLSKNKTVYGSKGKLIYSFRMNFVTLTLPSVQVHETPEIIKKCLNQFLIECAQQFDLLNYVWRLEYQKNGNAHFHIATDSYLPYALARDIWNRCLEKLGYITAYHNKNKGQSFSDYLKKNPVTAKTDIKTLKKRWAFGFKTAWMKPNTVDVRTVTNSSNISFYISKYITKKSNEPLNPIVASRENTNSNMRLWFCSRSLSKVDKISLYMDSLPDLFCSAISQLGEKKQIFADYCELWYFDIKKQCLEFKRLFRQILFDYARDVGYFTRAEKRLSAA